MSTLLFSDIFQVKDLDRDGKKFDRVSRINARSENYEMELTLDIHSELYPLDINDKFSMALATSLAVEGSDRGDPTIDPATGSRDSWRERPDAGPSLADSYDYVMHGRVYKYEEVASGGKVSVYVSYGGLLMCLEGDYRHLQNIRMGEQIFLLMRK